MHSSANDLDNSLHTSYLHGFDTDQHSHEVGHHENDVDINLFEVNHSWTKQIQFFILITIVLIANLNVVTFARSPPLNRFSPYIYSYLRPILRGPPISL